MKNFAFTLAEVLITLVIICIVAALTVPSVYNRYLENVTVDKVKKFYSTMSNAVRLSISEHGGVHTWNYGGELYGDDESSKKFWLYIKPHLIMARDNCENNGNCYYSGHVKALNNEEWYNYNSMSNMYKVILNDGSIIWFRTESNDCKNSICAIVWYDTNGHKKPNTFGRDIFLIQIYDFKVTPYLADDCNLNSIGYGCTKYILEHDNMNYLH